MILSASNVTVYCQTPLADGATHRSPAITLICPPVPTCKVGGITSSGEKEYSHTSILLSVLRLPIGRPFFTPPMSFPAPRSATSRLFPGSLILLHTLFASTTY